MSKPLSEYAIECNGANCGMHWRHETTVWFNIDGEDYSFTLIEQGFDHNTELVEFQADEDIPFDLDEEAQDILYQLYEAELNAL